MAQAADESEQPSSSTSQLVDEKPPEPAHNSERLKRLNSQQNERARTLFIYARNLRAENHLKRAHEIFENYLILYPRHEWRFLALKECAKISLLQGDRMQAVSYLLAAFRDSYGKEEGNLSYLEAGRILSEMGETRRAQDIFKELITMNPASVTARKAEIELNAIRYLHDESTVFEKE